MQGVCGCGRRTDFVKVEGNIGTEETGEGVCLVDVCLCWCGRSGECLVVLRLGAGVGELEWVKQMSRAF